MPPQTAQANSQLLSLVPFLLIMGIFYFMVIRPQKQEQKKHQEMLKGLEKNDEIVTTGGIHGVIVNVKEKTVVIRVDDNVKIEVERNCVAALVKEPQTAQGTKKEGK